MGRRFNPQPVQSLRRSTGGVAVVIVLLVLLVVAVVAVVRYVLGTGIGGGFAAGTEPKRLETTTQASAVRIENDCGPVDVQEGSDDVVRSEDRVSAWKRPARPAR